MRRRGVDRSPPGIPIRIRQGRVSLAWRTRVHHTDRRGRYRGHPKRSTRPATWVEVTVMSCWFRAELCLSIQAAFMFEPTANCPLPPRDWLPGLLIPLVAHGSGSRDTHSVCCEAASGVAHDIITLPPLMMKTRISERWASLASQGPVC
jgi:hypothetical protein